MTREEIVSLLEILVASYPNAKVSDPDGMVAAWELAFAEESAESIYKAARHHINTNKFFPTPADIRAVMVKASIVYDNAPAVPMIDAPMTSYIEDLTMYDNMLDLEPSSECMRCPKLNYCYPSKNV